MYYIYLSCLISILYIIAWYFLVWVGKTDRYVGWFLLFSISNNVSVVLVQFLRDMYMYLMLYLYYMILICSFITLNIKYISKVVFQLTFTGAVYDWLPMTPYVCQIWYFYLLINIDWVERSICLLFKLFTLDLLRQRLNTSCSSNWSFFMLCLASRFCSSTL